MNKLFLLICAFIFTSIPAFCLPYDYTSTKNIPIKLSITEEISTKMPITEGQIITFIVQNDAAYEGRTVVKKNELVTGRIETITTSGMNGFPAELTIDNFKIPNINKTQLISTYTKKGQNRCLWVYPLKWSLTWIPFVGSVTNLIKGGHARIKPSDTIVIYYYPEWR